MNKPTDFNDLAQLAGPDAVKAAVDQALTVEAVQTSAPDPLEA